MFIWWNEIPVPPVVESEEEAACGENGRYYDLENAEPHI